LHSAELELHLPGIPVNGTGLQRLCAATQNPNAHLEPVLGFKPDRVSREYRQTTVTDVTQIIGSHLDGEQMVTGNVINHPFFGIDSLAPPAGKQKYSPLPYLADTELLICNLAHWHEPGAIVQNYFFRELSGIWTGHMPVFEIMCEWDEIASGAKPCPNSAEAFKRACDQILKEYAEDEDF
jgi:(2Fe-2S) ferredoxin